MRSFKIISSAAIVSLSLSLALAGCATSSSATTTAEPSADNYVPSRSFSNADKAKAFAAVQTAGTKLGWKTVSADATSGVTIFQTPANLFTFGDTVSVVVSDDGAGARVDLTSTAAQLLDWGKNKDNVEKFYSEIGGILNAG